MPKKKSNIELIDQAIAETHPLTDDQWRSIQRSSGLPDDARLKITSLLRLWVHETKNQAETTKARKLVQTCRGKAKTLSNDIKNLSACAEFYYGTFSPGELRPRELSQ